VARFCHVDDILSQKDFDAEVENTNYDKQHELVEQIVHHEDKDSDLSIQRMLCAFTTVHHHQEVKDDPPGGKERSVHPSSSLLEQHHK
jgi:hypothetical protein